MNHCLDCGRKVSRGRTGGNGDAARCLVCETRRLFDRWRFLTPTMKLRRMARQENDQECYNDGTD